MTASAGGEIIVNNIGKEEAMYPIIDNVKTGERIQKFMRLKNLTAKDIQKELNLTTVQAVYHWINGRCLPSLENLYALSALFDVPMDLLVVGSREKELKEISSNCSNRLFAYYTMFNELVA